MRGRCVRNSAAGDAITLLWPVQPQSLGDDRGNLALVSIVGNEQRGPSQGPIDCFDMNSDVTKRVVEVKGHHTLLMAACDGRFE